MHSSALHGDLGVGFVCTHAIEPKTSGHLDVRMMCQGVMCDGVVLAGSCLLSPGCL
jgi:hypothetical protein